MSDINALSKTLVSTLWLDQNLQMPELRILDVRGKVLPATEPPPHYFTHRDAYEREHIPGATFIDWITEVTVNGPDQMAVAPPDKFARLMEAHGIGNQHYVVAYDDANGMFAARLWWILNYYGHDNVAVLDGGWDKWVAEGRPTTTEVPDFSAESSATVTFTPSLKPDIFRNADAIQAKLAQGIKLVDVRSVLEFSGEASRAARGGHIPGAVNAPRKSLLASDGTMLPAGVLRDKFVGMGVSEGDDVTFYCNSGVSASFGLLAYRVAFGDGGAMYDGSWKEWGNDDTRPLET